jgi:hypothetical protein
LVNSTKFGFWLEGEVIVGSSLATFFDWDSVNQTSPASSMSMPSATP